MTQQVRCDITWNKCRREISPHFFFNLWSDVKFVGGVCCLLVITGRLKNHISKEKQQGRRSQRNLVGTWRKCVYVMYLFIEGIVFYNSRSFNRSNAKERPLNQSFRDVWVIRLHTRCLFQEGIFKTFWTTLLIWWLAKYSKKNVVAITLKPKTRKAWEGKSYCDMPTKMPLKLSKTRVSTHSIFSFKRGWLKCWYAETFNLVVLMLCKNVVLILSSDLGAHLLHWVNWILSPFSK